MTMILFAFYFLLWMNGASSIAPKKHRSFNTIDDLLQSLDAVRAEVDTSLFLYQTPDFQWIPSSVYRYDDFRESLTIMATDGVASKTFYTGEDVENGYVYGLVNVAAFLAQSMKETIQYDACDENSWDFVNGQYPLSNACGQLGQSYQDYHCSEEEKHMECPVDPNMSITGVTHAKWYGAPGPMFCGPKTEEQPFSGFWDHTYECNKSWANPPESCTVYEDQKAGRYDQSYPVANTAGRTDVEGCCWWGRGVIQTSGVCNFGKLNWFLGAGAAKDGRQSRYPEIDFCKDPEIICSSSEYKELKWIAGMFYWIESVQGYSVEGWDYLTELRSFVEGGMTDTGFIDGVSGIVNRGCYNPPCGTGALDGGLERSANFKKVLEAFFAGSVPELPVIDSDVSATTLSTTSVGSSTSPGLVVENVIPTTPGNSALGTAPSYTEEEAGLSDYDSLTGASSTTPAAVGSTADGLYYPDYSPIWSLGKCINDSPVPSGRPNYSSLSECCEKAYGGQASGACLGSASDETLIVDSNAETETTSTAEDTDLVSSLWYPDYNAVWALGKCTDAIPFPNGRPTFETQLECCQTAYRGQASGECLADTPEKPSSVATLSQSEDGGTSPLDMWYADFNPLWSLGKCTNESPMPDNRPWFTSPVECCEKSYGGQASGVCLEAASAEIELAQSNVSFADAFSSYLQSQRYGHVISYECNTDIPVNSEAVDISYEYEYSVPTAIRADLVLKDLKNSMMEHLASDLGCQSTVQRHRRQMEVDNVVLGFQSAEGSDEIDTRKAYCEQATGEDIASLICVPVRGHLVVFVQHKTTREEKEATKHKILGSLASGQYTSSSILNVGNLHEYSTASILQSQSADAATKRQVWIAVAASLLIIFAIVLISTVFVIKRRRLMQIREMWAQRHDCEVSNIDHTLRTSFADRRFSDLGSEHDDSSDRSNSSWSQESDNVNDSPDSIVLSTSGSSEHSCIVNPSSGMVSPDDDNGGVNFVLKDISPYSCVCNNTKSLK